MLFKSIIALIICFFANLGFAQTSTAVTPPAYLSVPDWKSCMSTVKLGTASFVCLPDAKPSECSDSSWDRLNELNNQENSLYSCSKLKSNP